MDSVELYLHKLFCWLGTFFPASAFNTMVVAIITAFAGAYAGGRAAQLIAERNKLMNDVVKEMRANNASISVTFSIVNTLLNMKEQNIQPLKENFDAAKAEFDAVYEKGGAGHTPETPYTFPADLQTLDPPAVPIERLQKILFEETSISGRPLALVSLLAQTIHSLSQLLAARNDFIITANAAPEREKIKLPYLYFGKPLADGSVDERYPSSIYGIYQYTDDCIMYCKLLMEDLMKHGDDLIFKHKKRFGKHLPRVHKVDLSIALEKGLIPDEADYERFATSFKKHDEDV